MTRIRYVLLWAPLFFLFACGPSTPPADLILTNGDFLTMDAEHPRAEALAVRDGRIVAIGKAADMEPFKGPETEEIDLDGQFAMPGFIEGHGHFSGLGQSLMNLNFLQSKSWDEIVSMVAAKVQESEPGEWIIGRGWHQEKWHESPVPNILGYPVHTSLSEVSPDNPVMLRHASGHGLYANAKAMELAGISAETPNPSGGEIVRDGSGEAIGVFEERAMQMIYEVYQDYLSTLDEEARMQRWMKGIELAEMECLSKGVTSFQDAGSRFYELDAYREMAEKGELDLRLWAMVRHPYEELKGQLDGYPWIDLGDHYLTVRAIKSEVDGALGAYGAWLLEPYRDKPGFTGQNTTPIEDVEGIAQLAKTHGMQLCVHAIGDRANREVLDIMEREFEGAEGKGLRWRIEHAQHLDTADIPRFAELGVIAAMQAIHCTSDAPFVEKRLGAARAAYGAYPWRSLLDAGAVVTNGTDAPVEDVDPLPSLYASVTRKRADTGLTLVPEQAMTRQEALHSYTLANAYAGFEEDQKGSLEVGKLADIVVWSKDLQQCSPEEILQAEVLMTFVGGELKYSRD